MHNFDTLFLDRDGVINVKLDGRYVRNFSEFKFMPGALKSLAKLKNLFSKFLIVTNQQGIGKGIMSEQELYALHQKMLKRIENEGGVINKIYFCSHLVSDACSCRKPNIGMIDTALLDFPEIDVTNSYLVGDSDSDIEAGNKAGLNSIKLDNEYTLEKWTAELLSVY